MKLISSFFITCLGNFLMSLFSMLLLYIVYFDFPCNEIILIGIALNLFVIPAMYIAVYLPLYLFNRKEFLENEIAIVYRRYLFIVLIPITVVSALICEKIIHGTETKIILLNILISILFSFYLFTKTIKRYDSSTK